MSNDAFQVVRDLEHSIGAYTGFKYVAVVNSCTNALAICLEWEKLRNPLQGVITIPKRTYIGVACQIKRAGFKLDFVDKEWCGMYQLAPYRIWDSARQFRGNLWKDYAWENSITPPTMVCVSFHRTKILNHTQGGAILTNDRGIYEFAKQMRFDGRTEGLNPKDDYITHLGMHCYMDPGTAAELLYKLNVLPFWNQDLPNSDYPDLSQIDIFKEHQE